MAITIDETVGGVNSNSYVTEAEADTYFETRLNSSAYTGAGGEVKKAALVNATFRLDHERFLGRSANDAITQKLRWPRFGLNDRDGRIINSDIIPLEIKHAQFELALALLTADLQTVNTLDKFKSIKVDTIELEPNLGFANKLPDEVRRLISHFLGHGELIRG